MEQQVKILADQVMTLEEADEVEPLPQLSAPGSLNGEQVDAEQHETAAGITEAPGPRSDARPTVLALHVRVDTSRFGEPGLHRLRDLLGRRRGDVPVYLHLLGSGREVVMSARGLRVAATAELRAEIEDLLGVDSVWQE